MADQPDEYERDLRQPNPRAHLDVRRNVVHHQALPLAYAPAAAHQQADTTTQQRHSLPFDQAYTSPFPSLSSRRPAAAGRAFHRGGQDNEVPRGNLTLMGLPSTHGSPSRTPQEARYGAGQAQQGGQGSGHPPTTTLGTRSGTNQYHTGYHCQSLLEEDRLPYFNQSWTVPSHPQSSNDPFGVSDRSVSAKGSRSTRDLRTSSKISSQNRFGDTIKAQLNRIDGTCARCEAIEPDMAHMFERSAAHKHAIYTKLGMISKGLGSVHNAIHLCPSCHRQFDKAVPNLVLAPVDIAFFATAERRWQQSVTNLQEPKPREPPTAQAYELHCRQKYDPLYFCNPMAGALYCFFDAKHFLAKNLPPTATCHVQWHGDPLAVIWRLRARLQFLEIVPPHMVQLLQEVRELDQLYKRGDQLMMQRFLQRPFEHQGDLHRHDQYLH